MADVEQKRRGRKSKEEEVQEYLRSIGKDIGSLPDVQLEIPEDPKEMLAEFSAELYKQMRLGQLKSTGLVNGLRAIASLAEKWEKENPPEKIVDERGIEDILADVGLPRERRIELGREEIVRLKARTSALALVIAQIEGEA